MKYLIRPVKPEDAEQINALRRQPEVARTMLALPSERTEKVREHIEALTPDDHFYVAVTTLPAGSEKIIGVANLSVSHSFRTRHCGEIALGVDKNYWNQGIGSALMENLTDLADNWLRLVRLELTVDFDNEAAIHLYEKFGFEKEGVCRKACVRDGEYIDTVMMSRIRHAD